MRRALLRRCPYAVFFEVVGTEVIVYGILPLRERPEGVEAARGMSTRLEGYHGMARATIVAPEPKAGCRFPSVLP